MNSSAVRASVPIALAALAALAPSTAAAADLAADRGCYGASDRVGLSGGGFTPNGTVAITTDGRQLGVTESNAVGEIELALRAPTITGKRRDYTFTATDQADLALTASATVRVTSLRVRVTPKHGKPSDPRRVVARGFTSGRTLYAHVRRGKGKVRTLRVGRLKGACHELAAKRRFFSADAPSGVYRVQFDTRRRYSPRTAPQAWFLVTVFRKVVAR